MSSNCEVLYNISNRINHLKCDASTLFYDITHTFQNDVEIKWQKPGIFSHKSWCRNLRCVYQMCWTRDDLTTSRRTHTRMHAHTNTVSVIVSYSEMRIYMQNGMYKFNLYPMLTMINKLAVTCIEDVCENMCGQIVCSSEGEKKVNIVHKSRLTVY